MDKATLQIKIRELRASDPGMGYRRLAKSLGVSVDRIRTACGSDAVRPPAKPPTVAELAAAAIGLLKRGQHSAASLAKALGCDLNKVPDVLGELTRQHYDVQEHGAFIMLGRPSFGRIPINLVDHGGWFRFGLVADTHLGCREERLDALHAVYDLFEREGIREVFHAGNPVDGYIPRINGASAIVTTVDDQAFYFIDNYPRRNGIVTHYITGDDHEGWWIKEGFNFGKYLQVMAEREGRKDLRYIGHVEADVEIKTKAGSVIMKIQHPGGGSAYARSYQPQKQVESFSGGEKPQILVQGHYHVNNCMFERNVHVINLPGFQDQTVFARKKRLRMDVGGGIVEFKTNPEDGAITRFRYEMVPFFDRGYYRAFLRSDARLVRGHLVIDRRGRAA